MKYVLQVTIILGITFLGEVLGKIIPLPIHSSIYGMAILFLLLLSGKLALKEIEETGMFFITYMPIFILPAGIGLMDSFGTLVSEFMKVSSIMILPTIFVLIVSGKVTEWMLKK